VSSTSIALSVNALGRNIFAMVTYARVQESVVITGIGLVTPFGTVPDEFATALLDRRSGVAPVTQFDVHETASRSAAVVTGFDVSRWIPPIKSRRMDMTSQYAIAAAREAFDAAGVAYGVEFQDDVGVAVGTYTGGGSRTEEFLHGLFHQGPIGAPALLFNATVANVAASLVALELKVRGPNITISHKEVSGLTAAAHALDLLRSGQARMIVAAGVDALYPLFYKVHDRFGVLSRANGTPEGSRPFDVTRNGFVLGEGAYALVLERADAARARGAVVLAEILAVECGGTSPGINQWPTDRAAVARVMRRAVEASGLAPADIDVVYASANSSGLDAVEAAAIEQAFAPHMPIVTAVKGALGESAASTMAGLAAAVLCGRRGMVPPVAGLDSLDPACGHMRVARERESVSRFKAAGSHALVSGIASGGALAAAVLRVRAGI
jgi:3-oxoacyl-[acyl-carrier-protein] synthase II